MQPSELGLTSFKTSTQLPEDEVEAWLSPFTRDDWQNGVTQFSLTECPTGSKAMLKASAEAMASQSIIMSLVNVMTITAEGLPKKTASTPEERQAYRLAHVAGSRAGIEGALLAKALERIADSFGIPEIEDLAVFLSSRGDADQALRRSLARAFVHFWHGDYESCVYVVTPRIESAARALLKELDERVFKIEAGKDPGGYIGLYTLLDKLEGLGLDHSWSYFLGWLLVDQFGQNIRNDVAHGLTSTINAPYAALVLRGATLLIPLVAPQPASFKPDAVQGRFRRS